MIKEDGVGQTWGTEEGEGDEEDSRQRSCKDKPEDAASLRKRRGNLAAEKKIQGRREAATVEDHDKMKKRIRKGDTKSRKYPQWWKWTKPEVEFSSTTGDWCRKDDWFKQDNQKRIAFMWLWVYVF